MTWFWLLRYNKNSQAIWLKLPHMHLFVVCTHSHDSVIEANLFRCNEVHIGAWYPLHKIKVSCFSTLIVESPMACFLCLFVDGWITCCPLLKYFLLSFHNWYFHKEEVSQSYTWAQVNNCFELYLHVFKNMSHHSLLKAQDNQSKIFIEEEQAASLCVKSNITVSVLILCLILLRLHFGNML
jgi:hypothetical protein